MGSEQKSGQCASCGHFHRWEDLGACPTCGAEVCNDCTDTCTRCEGEICKCCAVPYASGEDASGVLCRKCVDQLKCGHVDSWFHRGVHVPLRNADGEWVMCEDPNCWRLLCDYCAVVCTDCGRALCESHANGVIERCYICHRPVCYEHNRQESVCGFCRNVVCREHREDWGLKEYAECLRCVQICDVCHSRVPSSDHLGYWIERCHYCGKKICSSCIWDGEGDRRPAFHCESCDVIYCAECGKRHEGDHKENVDRVSP